MPEPDAFVKVTPWALVVPARVAFPDTFNVFPNVTAPTACSVPDPDRFVKVLPALEAAHEGIPLANVRT